MCVGCLGAFTFATCAVFLRHQNRLTHTHIHTAAAAAPSSTRRYLCVAHIRLGWPVEACECQTNVSISDRTERIWWRNFIGICAVIITDRLYERRCGSICRWRCRQLPDIRWKSLYMLFANIHQFNAVNSQCYQLHGDVAMRPLMTDSALMYWQASVFYVVDKHRGAFNCTSQWQKTVLEMVFERNSIIALYVAGKLQPVMVFWDGKITPWGWTCKNSHIGRNWAGEQFGGSHWTFQPDSFCVQSSIEDLYCFMTVFFGFWHACCQNGARTRD